MVLQELIAKTRNHPPDAQNLLSKKVRQPENIYTRLINKSLSSLIGAVGNIAQFLWSSKEQLLVYKR